MSMDQDRVMVEATQELLEVTDRLTKLARKLNSFLMDKYRRDGDGKGFE